MTRRRRRLRTHARRHRLVRRMRIGLSVVGASLLAVGLRVAVVDAETGPAPVKPVPAAADRSGDGFIDRSGDVLTDRLADRPVDGLADRSTDGLADRPADGLNDRSTDSLTDSLADRPVDRLDPGSQPIAAAPVQQSPAGSVAATGAGAGDAAGANDVEERPAAFTRRFYLGLGGGLTQVKPRSRVAGLAVGDDQSVGYHVLGGYDFTRRISGEFYVADLGDAQIDFLGTDVGDLGYQVYGASVIAYLLSTRSGPAGSQQHDGLFRREGLSLYARAGIGGMRNDSALDYRRDHTAHLAFGGGLEYGFRNGFAVRAELMAFDTDARYATVSVLKRFGSVAAPVLAVPAMMPTTTPRIEPPAPPMVMAESEYTYFEFDQAELQPAGLSTLDALVGEIAGGEAALEVAGHTDSIGSDTYNLELSRRRAMAVQSYLVSRGVDAGRLRIEAFGESRPVADNATREGRATNRRVEISRR